MPIDKTDLKPDYMLLDDAAEYLKTTTRKIALFRKHGLLKASKLGKNYTYRRCWLDEFAEEWQGYDLSNESKIIMAISEKDWRERHGCIKGGSRKADFTDKKPHRRNTKN